MLRQSIRPWPFALTLLCALAVTLLARPAVAETLHLPVGGRPVLLSDGRVTCEALVDQGFAIEPGSRLLRVPTSAEAVGKSVELRVAPTFAACAEAGTTLTLVPTGRVPEIDPASVWFAADEGRLDATGGNLEGASIAWQSGTGSGTDTCHAPRALSGREECSWSVARGASVAPEVTRFYLLPKGARGIDDSSFFDAQARKINLETMQIIPARNTVLRVIAADATVDMSTGQGEIPLVHPEAVAAADCGSLSCEMTGGKLIVRGAANVVANIEVKVRLIPHVFVFRRDSFESSVSAKLLVMHCPMSIVSGSPVRDNGEAKVIVRLEGRCGSDISGLRFSTPDRNLRTLDTLRLEDAAYAVLRLGSTNDEVLTINAVRGEPDGVVIASAQASTRNAPPVRATLAMSEHQNLHFIPNNRTVAVYVSPAGENLRFHLLPIDGVYSVSDAVAHQLIKADPTAAGLTSLRFGVRTTNLPDRLNKIDLAVVVDPLQRSTGQANLPVPIEPLEAQSKPWIEVLCGGGREPLTEVQMGVTAHLNFALRDTCRVLFHRERLPPEYGTQKINFEVDVLRVDGTPKPQGHIAEVITMRAGDSPRYAWLPGITEAYDRISIRISHVADDNHYVGADDIRTGAPAAQWSIVMAAGRVRLYGTTTIPTGLYRFSKKRAYSGPLALNFGVISRLTWLNEEGREGILGAEAGVLVFGLANSESQTGKSLTQVGAVLGIGFAVPIANRGGPTQAAINLHAWLEINVTGDSGDGSRYALIFGPSISIGNVGANL